MNIRKISGLTILIMSIFIILTFWLDESLIGKLTSLMVGVTGIFEGKQLIQDKK